jgi:hypothetical protein
MGRGDPQREKDDLVRQRNSQQTMHFWSDEPTAFADAPSYCVVLFVQQTGFISYSYQDTSLMTTGHRQAAPTIQFPGLLLLLFDLWHVIPPLHPRTLRGFYGYLPDSASLFE